MSRRRTPRDSLAYRRLRARFIASTTPECAWCGRWVDVTLSGRLPDGPQVDHHVPFNADPSRFWDRSNWRLVHQRCNAEKGIARPYPRPDNRREW